MSKSTKSTKFTVGTSVTNSCDIRSYNANPKKRTLLHAAGTRRGVIVDRPTLFDDEVWVQWEDDSTPRSSHHDAIKVA